jgi:hypothetical protein
MLDESREWVSLFDTQAALEALAAPGLTDRSLTDSSLTVEVLGLCSQPRTSTCTQRATQSPYASDPPVPGRTTGR